MLNFEFTIYQITRLLFSFCLSNKIHAFIPPIVAIMILSKTAHILSCTNNLICLCFRDITMSKSLICNWCRGPWSCIEEYAWDKEQMAIRHGKWCADLLAEPWMTRKLKAKRLEVPSGCWHIPGEGIQTHNTDLSSKVPELSWPQITYFFSIGLTQVAPFHGLHWQTVVITSGTEVISRLRPQISGFYCGCAMGYVIVHPARINLSQETSLSIQSLTSQSPGHFSEYKEMPLLRDSSFRVHKGAERPRTNPPILPAVMQQGHCDRDEWI